MGKAKVVFVYTLQLLLIWGGYLYSGTAIGRLLVYDVRWGGLLLSFDYFSVHICHIYRYLFLSVIAAPECGGNGRVYFFHLFSPALFLTSDYMGCEGRGNALYYYCGVYWQTKDSARLLGHSSSVQRISNTKML